MGGFDKSSNTKRVSMKKMLINYFLCPQERGQEVMILYYNLECLCWMDIRKHFLTTNLQKHWNGLPRGVIGSPSLEVFKIRQTLG